MRMGPRSRDGRQTSTEKQYRAQARNGDHAGILRDEKHRELEAGVFRMEARDQLRLGFGQIERDAVRFRHRRNEKTKKAQNLRPDVPAKKSPLRMMRLRLDDFFQIKTAGHQQHADRSEEHTS